jgi:hypothetical protein
VSVDGVYYWSGAWSIQQLEISAGPHPETYQLKSVLFAGNCSWMYEGSLHHIAVFWLQFSHQLICCNMIKTAAPDLSLVSCTEFM